MDLYVYAEVIDDRGYSLVGADTGGFESLGT